MNLARAKRREQTTSTATVFQARAVLLIVVVGVVTFAAFVVLSAFAADLRRPQDGGTHILSRSAVGFAGMEILLEGEGRKVLHNRGPLADITDEAGLVVLTPSRGGRELDWDPYFIDAPVLLVLPKWLTLPEFTRPEWVQKIGLVETRQLNEMLAGLGSSTAVSRYDEAPAPPLSLFERGAGSRPVRTGPIANLQTIEGPDLYPLLDTPQGDVVLAELLFPDGPPGNHPVYVLADPDLLANHGISSAATAEAALQALDTLIEGDGPIIFDLTLHGMERSRNLLKLMFTPPYLPAILCLAFAAGLTGIAAFAGSRVRRPPRRELALGKTTLVDSSAVLIAASRRSVDIGRRYPDLVRNEAVSALGLAYTVDEAVQRRVLDSIKRHREDRDTFTNLVRAVQNAATPSALLAGASKLHNWKLELYRVR